MAVQKTLNIQFELEIHHHNEIKGILCMYVYIM